MYISLFSNNKAMSQSTNSSSGLPLPILLVAFLDTYFDYLALI